MYDICEVAITSPDPDWLADLTRQLVDTGLVACAHIAPIRVIYRSQGEVHDHVQSRAALHTRRDSVLAIVERVNRDHPDPAPCVIALPIADGSHAYMQWVRNQTKTTP
jgi:periplasmic divalent cation tolerance protein